MEGLFLLIWFYLYGGILFAMTSIECGNFPKLGWFAQISCWPVLLIIYGVRSIRESSFGQFIRFGSSIMKTPGKFNPRGEN